MKNLLSRKRNDEFTIYISGRGLDEEETVFTEVPMVIEERIPLGFDEVTGNFIFPPKPGPDEDPNYYVHPKYWYKRHPGKCGQGYRYAMEDYYENLAERRQERLAKLKAKSPLIASIVIVGAIAGIVLYKVLR